jgi:hypothetical protein
LRDGTCGFLGGRGVIVRSARGAVGGGSVGLGIFAGFAVVSRAFVWCIECWMRGLVLEDKVTLAGLQSVPARSHGLRSARSTVTSSTSTNASGAY